MDLGIKGKKAIVCASSRGLGYGCAEALAKAGVDLTICARTKEDIDVAATKLSSYGVKVIALACDVTTESGKEKLLEACDSPDILINNAGGPPPGIWSDWSRADFINAIEKSTGREAIKNFMPMQAGDVPATWADISSLEKLTGFRPQTDLKDGVEKFVNWYREYYEL